ncbi:MAG: gliding motility protein GldC, partial [Cyclobacteriaceae bacterium]|nr:gliding motility protein GldC [Cyclobacteriaceae bacterium]
MKISNINIAVELDDQNIPEKIMWDASEKPEQVPTDTKAISVALWDDKTMNTMRMDLWTKDMSVEEMKRFFINTLGGYAQMILNSTGDEYMASETN